MSSGEAFTNWRLLFAELADEADHPLQLNDFNYLTFGKRLTDTLEELQLKCIRIDNLDVEEVWRGIELTVNRP